MSGEQDAPSDPSQSQYSLLEGARARLEALIVTQRIRQFVSVGVAGATLETIIVLVLTAGIVYDLEVYAPAAKVLGAEASISLMFVLNDRWTFSDEGKTGAMALLRRYVKSHLVRATGILVAFAVLIVLTDMTHIRLVVFEANLWPTIANGIGIGVGMTINYVAESLITWRVHREN